MGRATGHRMLLSSTMYYYCVLFDMRPEKVHAWFYCSCFSHSPYSYLRYEYDVTPVLGAPRSAAGE